jgi:hypothetical protein
VVLLQSRVIDRHRLYTEWHEQFGRFVRVRVAHRNMLLVADPAAASSILVKGPGYVPRKPSEYTAFDVVSVTVYTCCNMYNMIIIYSIICSVTALAVCVWSRCQCMPRILVPIEGALSTQLTTWRVQVQHGDLS